MKKLFAILVLLLGLPILLFVYDPALQLGGLGLLLGGVGMTISPIVVLAALLYTAYALWRA